MSATNTASASLAAVKAAGRKLAAAYVKSDETIADRVTASLAATTAGITVDQLTTATQEARAALAYPDAADADLRILAADPAFKVSRASVFQYVKTGNVLASMGVRVTKTTAPAVFRTVTRSGLDDLRGQAVETIKALDADKREAAIPEVFAGVLIAGKGTTEKASKPTKRDTLAVSAGDDADTADGVGPVVSKLPTGADMLVTVAGIRAALSTLSLSELKAVEAALRDASDAADERIQSLTPATVSA